MSSQASIERENTDESLRVEREKTDQALVDRQAAVDENADQTVEQARSVADAVVATARATADELLRAGGDTDARPFTVLAKQRAAEDDALQDVRAEADTALRQQREENVRILAGLLPLERQKTDRYLLTERARADDAVAHRDDFLGIVTHDLRDLLSGIVLSAALLPDGASEPNGTKQRIQRYAARMNRLIGDLIDVASIDAGQLKVIPALGDWSALIEEVAALFQPTASTQGITLKIVLTQRSLPMRGSITIACCKYWLTLSPIRSSSLHVAARYASRPSAEQTSYASPCTTQVRGYLPTCWRRSSSASGRCRATIDEA